MTAEMSDVRRVQWTQLLPWVRIFRSGGRAVRPARLVCSLIALLLCYLGGRALDAVWPVPTIERDVTALAPAHAAKPRVEGPFRTFTRYESRCVLGAIAGLTQGRFSFAGSAFDERPALLGSVASGVQGLAWFFTHHWVFASVYGLFVLFVFAFFGGAICRNAAVVAARGEDEGLGASLRFVRERYLSFLLSPIIPLVVFGLTSLAMLVAGLIGAIPYLGEVLAGLFFVLALLGGLVLTVILFASLFGMHFVWPTIAVEGSDAFDGIAHAYSFVVQRLWRVLIYGVLFILYAAVVLLLARAMTLVLLKLTHVVIGTGMGVASNSSMESVSKLDAMWHMPAWSELALFPSANVAPIWGSFANAPLNWSETFGMWCIMLWVFLAVGLLWAFAINLYFCGSCEIYLLLRHDTDGTDWEEVYSQDGDDLLADLTPSESADTRAKGTPLPVVGEAAAAGGEADGRGEGDEA